MLGWVSKILGTWEEKRAPLESEKGDDGSSAIASSSESEKVKMLNCNCFGMQNWHVRWGRLVWNSLTEIGVKNQIFCSQLCKSFLLLLKKMKNGCKNRGKNENNHQSDYEREN